MHPDLTPTRCATLEQGTSVRLIITDIVAASTQELSRDLPLHLHVQVLVHVQLQVQVKVPIHIHNDTNIYIYIHIHTYCARTRNTTLLYRLHIQEARAASVCSFRPVASQPGPMTPAAFRSPLSTSKVLDIVTHGSGKQSKGVGLCH